MQDEGELAKCAFTESESHMETASGTYRVTESHDTDPTKWRRKNSASLLDVSVEQCTSNVLQVPPE
jgi:hypothetical protein